MEAVKWASELKKSSTPIGYCSIPYTRLQFALYVTVYLPDDLIQDNRVWFNLRTYHPHNLVVTASHKESAVFPKWDSGDCCRIRHRTGIRSWGILREVYHNLAPWARAVEVG